MAIEEGLPLAYVTDAFVNQYFHILRKMPQEAFKFYVDVSVVSRPGPRGTPMSLTSLEAITEHFLSCDYKSLNFEVVSVESQKSFKDGVLIMVIGFLTGKNNLKRKISQTFYLAQQKPRNYVVLNDIFFYLNEEASTPINSPVVESVPATKNDELNKTDPIRKIDKNVLATQKPTELVAETVAPQPDGAKIPFGGILGVKIPFDGIVYLEIVLVIFSLLFIVLGCFSL